MVVVIYCCWDFSGARRSRYPVLSTRRWIWPRMLLWDSALLSSWQSSCRSSGRSFDVETWVRVHLPRFTASRGWWFEQSSFCSCSDTSFVEIDSGTGIWGCTSIWKKTEEDCDLVSELHGFGYITPVGWTFTNEITLISWVHGAWSFSPLAVSAFLPLSWGLRTI